MFIIWRGKSLWVMAVALLCMGLVWNLPEILHWAPEDKESAVQEAGIFGMLLAGFICWSWGSALKRRDGWSHTLYYIPIQWIGILIIGGNAIHSAMGLWEEAKPKAVETATPTPAPMEKPLTASYWKPRDTALERIALADAVKKYPALGDLNSAFHARWKALSEEYRNTRPGFFENPSWPLSLAKDTDKLLKSEAPLTAIIPSTPLPPSREPARVSTNEQHRPDRIPLPFTER